MTRRSCAGRWARGFRPWLATLAGVLALPGAAAATHLDGFVFTFPGLPHGPEWSLGGAPITRTATWISSGPYLGTFAEETVTFQAIDALNIIALQNDRGYLSFDLILTGAWFGSDPDFETFFKVVANGTTLLDSTLSNDSLFVHHFDLIFDFTPFFPNCCTDVAIQFSASFGPGYDTWGIPELNPRWGLDNFVVSSSPIPEPATGGLVGLGLLLLASHRRRPGDRL